MTVEFVNGYPTEAVTSLPFQGSVGERVTTPVTVTWVGDPPRFDAVGWAEVQRRIGYAIASIPDFYESQEPGFLGPEDQEGTLIEVHEHRGVEGHWKVYVTYPTADRAEVTPDGQGNYFPEI